MKIAPVSFGKIYNAQHVNKPIFMGLEKDTFQKSFKGSAVNDFIKTENETGIIKKNLEMILTDSKYELGSGFSHKTYLIPDNEDYILRTDVIDISDLDFNKIDIQDTEDKNLDINIGQQVAVINVNSKGKYPIPYQIEVLKKQTGKSVGVPPYQAIAIEGLGQLRQGEKPYEDISRKETFAKSLDELAQLPVSAYEKLIDDIQKAGECGYSLDYLNSNNILYDSATQSINLIDMEKRQIKPDYGNVLYALTNSYYLNTFTSRTDSVRMPDDKVNKAIDDTITIITKYTQAMKNKHVKFDRKNHSYEFSQLMKNFPFAIFCQEFDSGKQWEILQNMGLA